MVATYTSIASEFKNQADGALVLTAYQLGYSVALTVVSERFYSDYLCGVLESSMAGLGV